MTRRESQDLAFITGALAGVWVGDWWVVWWFALGLLLSNLWARWRA